MNKKFSQTLNLTKNTKSDRLDDILSPTFVMEKEVILKDDEGYITDLGYDVKISTFENSVENKQVNSEKSIYSLENPQVLDEDFENNDPMPKGVSFGEVQRPQISLRKLPCAEHPMLTLNKKDSVFQSENNYKQDFGELDKKDDSHFNSRMQMMDDEKIDPVKNSREEPVNFYFDNDTFDFEEKNNKNSEIKNMSRKNNTQVENNMEDDNNGSNLTNPQKLMEDINLIYKSNQNDNKRDSKVLNNDFSNKFEMNNYETEPVNKG